MLDVPTQVAPRPRHDAGGPSDAISLLLHQVYQQAHRNCGIGLAAAATVVSVVFLFVLSIAPREPKGAGFPYAS